MLKESQPAWTKLSGGLGPLKTDSQCLKTTFACVKTTFEKASSFKNWQCLVNWYLCTQGNPYALLASEDFVDWYCDGAALCCTFNKILSGPFVMLSTKLRAFPLFAVFSSRWLVEWYVPDLVQCLVQFKTVSMRSEKTIRAPPRLSEVSPTSPLKQFQCSPYWRWLSLVLWRKIVHRFLFPCLSPPGDRWCDVLGFVPAGSVSSSAYVVQGNLLCQGAPSVLKLWLWPCSMSVHVVAVATTWLRLCTCHVMFSSVFAHCEEVDVEWLCDLMHLFYICIKLNEFSVSNGVCSPGGRRVRFCVCVCVASFFFFYHYTVNVDVTADWQEIVATSSRCCKTPKMNRLWHWK